MEKGHEKIQRICEVLRNETLEPALQESELIISDAKKRAETLILEAEVKANSLIQAAHAEIERERLVFQGSLVQGIKQAIEMIRQEIEKKLFEPNLEKYLCQEMVKPETIANLIKAIVSAIEKEGLGANLEVIIPKKVPAADVSAFLLAELKNTELVLGDFFGGAKVKISEKNMTIEITDKVLKQLVASYVRKDFREKIFQ